LAGFGSA